MSDPFSHHDSELRVQSEWADFALARHPVSVGRLGETPILLALLGCGIQTGDGTIFNVLTPEPGANIAIFGAGAVGLAAIMAARLTGANRIVVVDLVQSRLDLAVELGATHAINSRDLDITEFLLDLTDGWGIDYAIDATGNTSVIRNAIMSLAPLGTLALVGAPVARHRGTHTVYSFATIGCTSLGIGIYGVIEAHGLGSGSAISDASLHGFQGAALLVVLTSLVGAGLAMGSMKKNTSTV